LAVAATSLFQFMSAFPQLQNKPDAADFSAAQQLLEFQTMEAIGRLVSGVAHDFNNLLTGIVLCSDLLLAGLENDSRLRRYAQEIREAGAQGADLIQQLLAVARRQVVMPHALSLNTMITGMRNLLSRLIGENIEIIADLADDLPLVKMDPAQAQQIILNLVLNARDAMPDGGPIRLSTRPCGAPDGLQNNKSTLGVEFEVCDTGCGMDRETRARIFQPFFSTKKAGKGNGLGMTTVYSIVEKNGGTIGLESEPGHGTRIIVRLPGMAPESAASDLEAREAAVKLGPTSKHIPEPEKR
jgi:two-component system cell cycle sensor histidine kinase/response regulator CckA